MKTAVCRLSYLGQLGMLHVFLPVLSIHAASVLKHNMVKQVERYANRIDHGFVLMLVHTTFGKQQASLSMQVYQHAPHLTCKAPSMPSTKHDDTQRAQRPVRTGPRVATPSKHAPSMHGFPMSAVALHTLTAFCHTQKIMQRLYLHKGRSPWIIFCT